MHPLCTLPMHGGIGTFPYIFRITMASATASTPPGVCYRKCPPLLVYRLRERSAPAGVDALALTTTIVSGTVPTRSDTDRRTILPPISYGPAKPSHQTPQLPDVGCAIAPHRADTATRATIHRHPAFAACLFFREADTSYRANTGQHWPVFALSPSTPCGFTRKV